MFLPVVNLATKLRTVGVFRVVGVVGENSKGNFSILFSKNEKKKKSVAN